ncbi:zinc-dependent metalloprotease [Microbacterium sp. STN6]|uniref:zinc-dependent metalloprotease n=1 Tax=Microbacterium sp. STN6 TaxID=2995588 RepID=UPI002260A396|nr:zinc-dependent metalloprotease [Microbacterium sp. STN6]MCX7521950.1 zinc-dependent metalloprotease [Microbacterium sp. STN6]
MPGDDNEDRPDDGANGDGPDDFLEMLREMLSGSSSMDASQLAGAAGLPNDPAAVAGLISQLQNAMRAGGGINWDLASEQARTLASEGAKAIEPGRRSAMEQAFHVAALWLDEAAYVSELSGTPTLTSRAEWVRTTMPLWIQLAEPVALSIAAAITRVFQEQAPEEMRSMVQGAESVIRSVGGALFAMQLGQVVGQLSREVVSGGDIGIPLLDDGSATLLPQNVEEFGAGLDIAQDQVELYLAVRELAHARLFRHARWMRLQLITSITEYARGISIDTGMLEEVAENFDPSNPEELRQIMASGALIPPKSPAQEAALARLETMLALVEGWVDVVTRSATTRLPSSDAIAEMVRRRRAAGGPAESAFATLVGLELRPRRLREAAAMWQQVTDAVGAEARDRLWSHPDLLPDAGDLDDPAALVARLRAEQSGQSPEPDELDQAIEDLLRDDGPDERPTEQ